MESIRKEYTATIVGSLMETLDGLDLEDIGCGHRHKSQEAAERCGKQCFKIADKVGFIEEGQEYFIQVWAVERLTKAGRIRAEMAAMGF